MLKFKGSWRNYQKRILDSLEYHLLDEKLHVVAAPGAGKTTLGIEVISRLNKPALILCPTNTIKNQWKDRICSAFLDEENYSYVSTDIRKPSYLTVTTYQALLAAFCEGKTSFENAEDLQNDCDYNEQCVEDDFLDKISSSRRFSFDRADEIIKIFKNAKISLLCFDEAHHLRKEWWKALTYLVEELEPKQTLSLTATPPYDVDYAEWERYEELCGPIDEVISIPELVKNGDLCPHQDLIYFSQLKESENKMVRAHNSNVSEFLGEVFSDRELFQYLSGMKFLNPTESEIEKIYDNPELYVAIASILKSSGVSIPRKFLNLFGAKENEIPNFDLNQAKAFLNGFLVTNTDDFSGLEEKIEKYNNLAKRLGLVQNKKIVLNESLKIQKQIAKSLGKLDSIVQIAEIEDANLGDKLRMVVLADYIKADDLNSSQLGVIPIWRVLKNKFGKIISIGVLSGSVIIIPQSALQQLKDLIEEENLSSDCVSFSNYNDDENYISVTPKESVKHKIVSLITQVFNEGAINILIGTQALLGEGWDAPSINSLILSSTISSYMLSNQMRGRAIRVDKNNPDKVSNIWHLASVIVPNKQNSIKNVLFDQTVYDSDIENDPSFYDLVQLTKRFEGFEAPSYYGKHEIMSGISRVITEDFPNKIKTFGNAAISEINNLSSSVAQNREQTKKWWNEGLNLGYNASVTYYNTGVNTPRLTAKSLVYSGYKQVLYSIVGTFLAILYFIFSYGLLFKEIIFLWGLCFLIALGYLFVKYIKTGSVCSILKQIAIVHLETLSYLGYIKTHLKNVGISVSDNSYLYLSCKNLPIEENNLLIKCLQEFLDPIDNPRYILIKRGNAFGLSGSQTDYFAIPSIISTRKKDVEIFKSLWEKYIGYTNIVYTRNQEGRKLLLKARKGAFSSVKREKSKKLSKWN